MADSQKNKKQLIDDLGKMRRRLARLESLSQNRQKNPQRAGADQQKYKAIYDNLPDALAGTDMNGKFIECNRAFAKMLGYTVSEIKKLSYRDITPRKWHDIEKKIVKDQVIKKGHSDIYRKEYKNKQGKIIQVELRMFLMRDQRKKPIGIWAVIRNISDIYKNEQKIRRDEEKYRNLVETINDWVWEINQEGVYSYASPKVTELLGYEPEEIIGKKPTDLMPPEEAARVKSVLDRAVKNRQPIINLVNSNLHKNGDLVVLETNARPILDDSGKFIGYRGVDRDITERKKAEDALKEREAALQSLFRAAPTGIGLVINRVFIDVNDRFCNMIGYSKKELIGKSARLVYPSREEFERVGKIKYDQIYKDGTGTIETRMLRKDGRIIHVLLSSTPLNTEDLSQGVTFTALDITERKRAEEALQASEREKAVILNSVSENVTLQDKDLKLLWANRAAVESIGSKNGPILGAHCFEVWNNLHEPCDGCPVEKALSSGKPEEAEMATPDGRYWWVRGFPITDNNGEIIGVVEVTREITDEKMAEAKLIAERNFTDTVVNSLPGIFYLFDDEGKFIKWNKNFENVSGYSAAEMTTIAPTDLFTGDDRKLIAERIAEVFAKGESSAEGNFTSKTGKKTPYYFTGYRLTMDNKDYVVGMGVDVTELKHAEEMLRESEEKYRTVVERAYEGIVILQDFIIKYVNPRLAELLGYDIAELEGMPYKGFIHPEELEKINENYARRLTGENIPMVYETRFVHKSGRTIYIELNGSIVQYQGKPADLAFIRDITERKMAERALKESEERLDLAIQGADLGMWDWNISTGKVILNEKWAGMLGYKLEEINSTFEELRKMAHPDDLPAILNNIQAHLDGDLESFEAEYRLRTKTGEWRWFLDKGKVVEYDKERKPVRATGTHLDITDRKRAEEELQKSEKRYQELFNSVLEGIALVDDREVVEFCNPAYADIFGAADPADMVNRSIREFIPPDKIDLFERHLQIIKQGHSSRYELEIRLKKGEKKIIYLSCSPRFDDARGYLGSFCAVMDITEQKLLEEQFLQSQKMESIGRLAGGVAHDFNNLLTAIIGHTEIALFNIDKDSPVKKDITVIQEAADRAADLTQQLLAFSRRQTLEPRVIDLNAIIENMGKMLQRIIGEDIVLKTFPFENLWPVKVDPGQIEQVIINLAVNARDAMPEGGTLTIETANMSLDNSYQNMHHEVAPGPYVMLSISDTGIGISDEVKEHIFEPFYTTKRKGQGTGLGLSTVFGIINQSDGHIWVYSEVDKGTSFKIYLPKADGRAEVIAPAHVHKEIPTGTESILVVEDEDTVRQIACMALSKQGYKIIEAKTGDQAIEICQNQSTKIDLIVTDVVMPIMHGTEMIELIHKFRPDLKPLFMSGYTENAIVEKGILKPGISYIQKPFRPHDLAIKVREVLDHNSGHQAH